MRKAKMFKKCLVYTLIGALTLSNITPALAYDHLDKVDYDSNKNSIAEVHEEVNVTEDGTSQATVYAELGKEFTITVPKSLTLSGQTKSGTYTVSVEGDIAGTDKINVIPDETFTLNSSGLDSITASINQDKTSWGYNEILTDSKVIGNGEINASNLSAGKWNGTFNFNINLEESAGSEEDSKIEVSFDDETTQEVTMGANDSVQIDVFLGEDNVNDQATWSSDNENVTVNNGLVKATEAAKNGETANITATIGDKTITVKITVTKQEESPLTLSVDDEVAIGAEESLQVNAYLEGELANDLVDWNSNNENITVTNGLIETKASAQIGDSATITVTAENPDTLSAMANTLNDLGIATVAMAEDDISIEFTVTIVDIEYSVDEINLKPGESMDVTAKIIPEEINGTVRWSQTAVSGLNLVKNGNTVTIKVAEDMETGKSYNIVATYGDYSKTLTINIISDHEHNYKWEITTEPTCMENGIKTYTCDCGDSYEEIIYASDEYHDYESEYKTTLEPTCTEVGYKTQYCSICTYALDEIELPATGHNYIETVTDATCTANGNKHYECDVCGDSYDETITSSGHTYEEGNYTIDKAATCEEAGSKSVHCEVCDAIIEGTSVEIEATGHNYPSFWTTEKEATCLEAGLEQRICINDGCGKVETREVEATGEHTYTNSPKTEIINLTNTSNGTYAFIQNGTKWTSNNSDSNYSDATSTWTIEVEKETLYTFKYNFASEKYGSLTIKLDDTQIIYTNVNEGEKEYTIKLTQGTHTIYADYYNYNHSGKGYYAYIILPEECTVLEHVCEECETIAAHTYVEKITTEPTCTETGVKTFTCECGYSYTETIKAAGHTWGDWQEQIAATCGTAGKNIRYCTIENCDGSSTQTVAATGNHTIVGTACSVCGRPTIESGESGLYGADSVQIMNWTELYNSGGVRTTGTTLTQVSSSLKDTLVIDNTITEISDNAFKYSGLTNLKMSNNITTLGESILSGSDIKEVTLSKNIVTIPQNCFVGSTDLETVNIPSDSKLTTIEASAFESCTALGNITLPASIKTIGNKAFYGSSYASSTGTLNGTIKISDSASCTIGENNFYGLKNVAYIDLGGTTSLGTQSIYKCNSLKSIDFGTKLTKIDHGTVNSCPSITSVGGTGSGADVIIPSTVKSIGTGCFSSLDSVKTIEIPSTVTTISAGSGTLSRNSNVESTKIMGAVTLIDEYGYSTGLGAYSSGTLYIKKINSDSDSGIGYFYGTEVTIGGGLLSDRFAMNLFNVEKITLGNESTTTFEGILHFSGASKLTSLNLGSYVTNLGDNSFYQCTGLTDVTIPINVTKIGRSAFDGCTKLTSVTFKDTTTWYYGSTEGATTNTITSTNLSDTSTAAKYLTNDYKNYYWTKK